MLYLLKNTPCLHVTCCIFQYNQPATASHLRSDHRGGRIILVTGHNLDVVQEPRLRVTLSPPDPLPPRRRRRRRRRRRSTTTVGRYGGGAGGGGGGGPGAWSRPRRIVPDADCPDGTLCGVKHVGGLSDGDNIITVAAGVDEKFMKNSTVMLLKPSWSFSNTPDLQKMSESLNS